MGLLWLQFEMSEDNLASGRATEAGETKPESESDSVELEVLLLL